ncbi:hypothetical protein TrLO_g11529 [Triparma laevis f. longispina]|uniref:Uncharacterized protein n=1 Tax=Triparma laevis f. longispina TaxID=1714387 RepID=A0A9W7F7N4_9STRA|nr:hypothetical protein TrLO_g11529 [Triparma laevis f. longispina]
MNIDIETNSDSPEIIFLGDPQVTSEGDLNLYNTLLNRLTTDPFALGICAILCSFLVSGLSVLFILYGDKDNEPEEEDENEFKSIKIIHLIDQPSTAINLPAILPSINLLSNPQKKALLATIKKISPAYSNKEVYSKLKQILPPSELSEFLQTGLSNSQKLKWDLMEVQPNQRFSLHAHPNAEMILCVKGRIHEFRLTSSIPTTTFDPDDPEGPPLDSHDGTWEHRTLLENQWLINTIGSVHITFTDKESGCLLLVLWSGKHAKIEEELYPKDFNVDERVGECQKECVGCGRGGGRDFFLPGKDKDV